MKQEKDKSQYDVDSMMARAVLKFWRQYGDAENKFEHRGARVLAELVVGDSLLFDKFVKAYCAACEASRKNQDSVVLSKENFKHLRGW